MLGQLAGVYCTVCTKKYFCLNNNDNFSLARLQRTEHPDGQVEHDQEGGEGGRQRAPAHLHGLRAPHPGPDLQGM